MLLHSLYKLQKAVKENKVEIKKIYMYLLFLHI